MRPQINKENQANSVHKLVANALLCFLLVFVQGAGLAHTHEGDLQKQFDCDICLKVNSSEDVIPSSNLSLSFNTDLVEYNEQATELPFVAAIPANSRAPPLA